MKNLNAGIAECAKMAEWIEWNGSDEQAEEMQRAENGWIWGDEKPDEGSESVQFGFQSSYIQENMTRYFIITEDTLREMKIRQSMTGQPVWVKKYHDLLRAYRIIGPTTTPDWNIPNAEYSFSEFKD